MIMNVSPEGLAFIARHEGFSSRAYMDPAGVPTIGYGFTLASRLFRDWWTKRGRKDLKAGDMIDRAEANTVLKTLADHEYGAAVLRRFGKLPQNQFDAVVSAVYNLGEQCLSWRWAAALAAGNVAEAARLLAMTGIRAGGRILPGLVRRRSEEAQLLQGGDYGFNGHNSLPEPDPEVMRGQQMLARLGFKPGPADGIEGPITRAAVLAFQIEHPPLKLDGRLGPATLSELERAVGKQKGVAGTLICGATGAGVSVSNGDAWVEVLGWGLALAGLAFVIYLAWANRGRIRLLARQFIS